MTEHRLSNGMIYRTADSFTAAGGAVHAFSTRFGGVSTGMWESLNLATIRGDDPNCVWENYRRLCSAIGADFTKVVKTRQVHGNTIRVITGAGDLPGDPCAKVTEECDGLITDFPGAVLTVYTADCTPILLYDPKRRAVGAVHAGWRGTAVRAAGTAAALMQKTYGCRGEDILAAIGPSIAKCCFETDADVPEELRRVYGAEADPFIFPDPDGKFHVDLKSVNALDLTRAGLLPEHIEIDPECTACQPRKYWSHRRVGLMRGNQCGMIALCPDAPRAN